MPSSTGPDARADDDQGAQDPDGLEPRTARMEQALEVIAHEIDHALEHPEIQHLALCRLATLVTRARARARARVRPDAATASPPSPDDERHSGVRVVGPPAAAGSAGGRGSGGE